MKPISISLVTFFLVGCATGPSERDLRATLDSERLIGWLDAQGEWALHQLSEVESYSPFSVAPDRRCISLVNNTGRSRNEFARLQGLRVTIIGEIVSYDDLDDDGGYLNRKIYEGEIVHNFCLRDEVFIVRSMVETTQ